MLDDETGSAVVESVVSILVLLVLVLGTIEVAYALYARNVVASAAHEGARAVLEDTTDPLVGRARAEQIVRRSAGGLISDARVQVTVDQGDDGIVEVLVVTEAEIDLLGPVPLEIPVRSLGRASTRASVP